MKEVRSRYSVRVRFEKRPHGRAVGFGGTFNPCAIFPCIHNDDLNLGRSRRLCVCEAGEGLSWVVEQKGNQMRNRRLIACAVIATLAPWAELRYGSWLHIGGARNSLVMGASIEVTDESGATVSVEVEPIDGSGNNVANPTWGTAGSDLLRLAPVGYADGIDSPALPNDQSARVISNIMNNQADPSDTSQDVMTVDQNSLSDFGYAFGQFMDHDMDNTPDGGASLPIAVAANDPIGPAALPFTRSLTDPSSKPAQQINSITSYLDLSQVYGSSQVVATALRTLAGGLMKTSPGNMLPYDNTDYFTADQIAALNMANDAQAVPESQLFAAGDVRGNENIELTTLVTLFVRNHNLIASELEKEHPDWTDEELYQEARKLNIAEYQNIIYNEWIPAVLGPRALPAYTGYKPNVNASISNEFSTVAFRFGHSLVSPSIARDGNDGQGVTDSISLAFDFFDPNLLNPAGTVDPLTGLASTDIGPILKGEADGNGQAMDLMAISDIRDLLFGNGGEGGQDLIALDVQRGRDHGIADYNTLRSAFGLPRVKTLSDITANSDPSLPKQPADAALIQRALKQAYPAGVNSIDAFEGGLSESAVPGSDVGPTFQAIMVDQFRRLRDGDRFFYLNESFNADENAIVEQGNTLAKIIMANTDVTNLQDDVMIFQASISGTVTVEGAGKQVPPPPGPAGITVELEDTSGDVLATTHVNLQGQFSFNQLSGPAADAGDTPGVSATGEYVVAVLVPRGMQQVSSAPGTISISHGDSVVSNINFTLAPAAPARVASPPPPRPQQPLARGR